MLCCYWFGNIEGRKKTKGERVDMTEGSRGLKGRPRFLKWVPAMAFVYSTVRRNQNVSGGVCFVTLYNPYDT